MTVRGRKDVGVGSSFVFEFLVRRRGDKVTFLICLRLSMNRAVAAGSGVEKYGERVGEGSALALRVVVVNGSETGDAMIPGLRLSGRRARRVRWCRAMPLEREMLCCRTRLREEDVVNCSGSLSSLFPFVTSDVMGEKAAEKNGEISLASSSASLSSLFPFVIFGVMAEKAVEKNGEISLASSSASSSVVFESPSPSSLLVAVSGVGTRGRGLRSLMCRL